MQNGFVAKRKAAFFFLITLAVLLSTGCVSTPARRIARNPELFASFPPDVQEQVRRGHIAIGFDKDMVRMALGEPDRVYERKTDEGSIEVWAYLAPCLRYDTDLVPVEFYRIDRRGCLRVCHDWVWVRTGRPCYEERIRVEFRDARVSAIETLQYP